MRGLALITLIAAGLAVALGGTAPFGRVLLSLGVPGLAAGLFEDPAWQGVAHYRAGDMERARSAFLDAGAHYNLGNAEVRLGAYAASLEAYDMAISGAISGAISKAIAEPNADARANFDLVAGFYGGMAVDPDALGQLPKRETGPDAESFVAEGDARAAGTGDEVTNTNTMLGLAELDSRGQLGVRRIFNDRFMVADERWLQQLADVPGDYLKARIAQEAKSRAKLGLTPPDPEDPR